MIPPPSDAGFVAAMEDVLEVYHRPYDERRPLVCLDETNEQLVGEVVVPIPAAPGRPERVDYESVRHGTANLFMISEPLPGRLAGAAGDRAADGQGIRRGVPLAGRGGPRGGRGGRSW